MKENHNLISNKNDCYISSNCNVSSELKINRFGEGGGVKKKPSEVRTPVFPQKAYTSISDN